MSREPGAFVDPFALSAATEHGAMMEGADYITSEPGTPGAVSVTRTPGRPPQPHNSLTGDPTATVYGPLQPPISAEHRKAATPTAPPQSEALARALELVAAAKSRASS